MTSRFKLLGSLGKTAVGLIFIIVLIEITGEMQDVRGLLDLEWPRAWPVVGWTFLINLIAAWRWQILITYFAAVDISFAALLKTVILGRFVGNATSQLVGDLGTRSLYLKSQGVDFKTGGLTLMADKGFEVLFACVVGFVFLSWVLAGNPTAYLAYYPLAAVLLFGFSVWTWPSLFSRLSRTWPGVDKRLDLPAFLFGKARWLLALLTVAKYLVVVARFAFILRFCGVERLDFFSIFFGTVWGQIGLMVSFTPGGLGFVEAGWSGALYYFDVPASAIPAFLIAQRLLIGGSVILLVPVAILLERLSKYYNLTKDSEIVYK